MPNRIPDSTDVLVVGAGLAGSVAAARTAQAGLATLLVDRLPARDVGGKVCGNGITDEWLEAAGRWTVPPSGAEIAWRIDAGVIVLADPETRVRFPRSGVLLNRSLLGQRLLADAVEAGSRLVCECACVGWKDRGSRTVRLRSEDSGDAEVTSRVIIDASGYRSVLAGSGGVSHRDPVHRSDVGIGYREIAPLNEPLDSPREAVIDLGASDARGGYAWVFPLGDRLVNVGIGAPLATPDHDLKESCRAFARERAHLSISDPVVSGTGLVPLRRPLASMVGDGFLVAGDAACQAEPLHGGGIHAAIIGGGMAADRAIAALANGSVTVEALWGYNTRFMREVGYAHAASDLLRKFLVALPPGEFDRVALELALAGLEGESRGGLAVRARFGKLLRLLGNAALRPSLARRVFRAGRIISSVRELYRDYPESKSGFESWVGRVEHALGEMAHLTG